MNAMLNLHVNLHYGENLHHIAEALFKAFGRALAEASRHGSAHRGRAVHEGRLTVIAIVDYGRGNLGSVQKALAESCADVVVTDDPRVVARARALVVPGRWRLRRRDGRASSGSG